MGEQGFGLGKEEQVSERVVWQTQGSMAWFPHTCQVIKWISFE